MIAGLILKSTTEEESQLAFLGEKLECVKASKNSEIVEEIKTRKPDVVAVNAGMEEGRQELTQKEEELKEEGYNFTPTSHDVKRTRRTEALKSQIFNKMGGPDSPQIIRFDPHITADELALHGDESLESIGVDTSNIESAEQFDAALGAVTARFYQQNQFEDLGVIVPEPVDEQSE